MYIILPRTWISFELESIKIIKNTLEFYIKIKDHLLSLLSELIRCDLLFCPACHLVRKVIY